MVRSRIPFLFTFLASAIAGWWIVSGQAASAAEESSPRCEAVYHESGIEPFGRVFSARAGQEIALPDFRLRVAPDTGSTRILQLKRVNGEERHIEVPVRHAGAEPHEFEFDGRRYVVEINHSVAEFRALNRDELAVWPRDEYRATLTAAPAR